MSVRTLQAQIDSLLNKDVVRPKVNGVPSPDLETASIIESLALAMMLQPKSAFYSHYLAKSGLISSIISEVAAIEVLKADIADLGNNTYAIRDTTDLARAQAAMLQLSAQGQMSSESSAFARYDAAINDFLNKQLAKNIRKPNSTEMVRPGEEASLSLPGDLDSLKGLHSSFLDRLYALAVGISNFTNTPFNAIVGANAVYRAKKDLDSLIYEVGADPSGSQSRDAAVRLISGRSTIKMVGGQVDMLAPVVDTVRHLPPDQLISGSSPATPAVATTAVGPFVLTALGELTVTVAGQAISDNRMNAAENKAALLNEAVTYPVSVPPNYHLFLRFEAIDGLAWEDDPASIPENPMYREVSPGTLGSGWKLHKGSYFKDVRIVLNSGSPTTTPAGSTTNMSMSQLDILTLIQDTISPLGLGSASYFIEASTQRMLLYASSVRIKRIAIINSMAEMPLQSDGTAADPGSTAATYVTYSNSFHSALGFSDNQIGITGSTPTRHMLGALNFVYQSILLATQAADGSIVLTSAATSPGVTLELSGAWAADLGVAGSYPATSSTVILHNEDGDLAPTGVVDLGDTLQSSTGQGAIVAMSASGVTLSSPLTTFSGNITVTSSLDLVWSEINSQVNAFLASWLEGPFASGLTSLDRLVAVLIGSPTSPRRNEAIDLLDTLKTQLLELQAAITTPAATLAPNGATKAKSVVNNIISVFSERKFDRAMDFLLKCKLQEIFELDWQSASFSGNLMKAAEGIAQSDVKFPDVTKDEGFDVVGRRPAHVVR
jgi:hypothetical protein